MKVIVVDDNVPSLLSISGHVNSYAGFRMLAIANDGYELIKFLSSEKELPDIVLLDVQMEKIDGVAIMEFLGSYFPDSKVIAVSAYIDECVISDLLAGGAWGYVFKDKEMSTLKIALESVASGQPYVDQRLFYDAFQRDQLIKQRVTEREMISMRYGLSRREKEILALVASNLDYKEMGDIFHISPKTIENIVNGLTKKFCISNGRAGLLLHSLRLGLTRIVNLRSSQAETGFNSKLKVV